MNVWQAQFKYSTLDDPTGHESPWVPMTRDTYTDNDGEVVNYIRPSKHRIYRGDRAQVQGWFKRLGEVFGQTEGFDIQDVKIIMDLGNPSRLGKETTVVIGNRYLILEAANTKPDDNTENLSRKRSGEPLKPEVPAKRVATLPPRLVPQKPPIFMKADKLKSGVYKTQESMHGNIAIRANIIRLPGGDTRATIHFIKSNEENLEAQLGPMKLIDDWDQVRVDLISLPEAQRTTSVERVNALLEKVGISPVNVRDITLSVYGPRRFDLHLGQLPSGRPARTFKLYRE